MTLLKALVLALVLANIGFFLWSRDLAEPVNHEAAGSASAPTILLASEVPAIAAAHVVSSNVVAQESTSVASAAGSAPADFSASVPSNTRHCVTIGPFRDVSEAARAATTLRGMGYGPSQRVADGEVWAGVWVYLTRPDARAAADQVVANLKKAGIDDALEMPGPNDSPVISLGLFSEPKRAQARLAQAQGVGLNPRVADRRRNGDVYWIDVDMKNGDKQINATDLRGEAGRIVRLEVKSCPAVTP